MDIIYHSIPNMWKNKMIEQGFNHANCNDEEMTYFFTTRVEKLERRGNKKKFFVSSKKKKDKRGNKKRKRDHLNTCVVESSEESFVEHRTVKMYCILYGKYLPQY